MAKQRQQIVYISDATRQATRDLVRLAADDYRAAKEAKDTSAALLDLRRKALLAAIDEFRAAVVEGKF